MPHICQKNLETFHNLAKRYHQHLQQGQLCQQKQETELERLLFLPSSPFLPPLILIIFLPPLVDLVNLLPPIVCAFSVKLIYFSVKTFPGVIFCLHPPILVDRWIHIHVVLFCRRRAVVFPFQLKESLSFLFIIISLISFFVSNLLQFSYVNILYFLEK